MLSPRARLGRVSLSGDGGRGSVIGRRVQLNSAMGVVWIEPVLASSNGLSGRPFRDHRQVARRRASVSNRERTDEQPASSNGYSLRLTPQLFVARRTNRRSLECVNRQHGAGLRNFALLSSGTRASRSNNIAGDVVLLDWARSGQVAQLAA